MAETRPFVFLRWLGMLISRGMPLPQAIETASQGFRSRRLRRAVRKVKESMKAGASLCRALSRETSLFPPIYVAAIAEAERRGNLESTLKSLCKDAEESAAAGRLIKGQWLYPTLATVAVFLVILVGAFVIMPVALIPARGFMELVESFDTTLPSTGFTFFWAVGKFIAEHGVAILVFLCGAIALVLLGPSLVRSHREGSLLFGGRKLRLPVSGQASNLIIFCRTLGTYLKYGLSLNEGLAAAHRAVSSKTFREHISRLPHDMEAGATLPESMRKSPWFPGSLVRAVAAGESTGQTASALLEMADFYREEAENRTQKSARWPEGALGFVVVLFGLLSVAAVLTTVLTGAIAFWR